MTTFTFKEVPALYRKYKSLSAICRGEGVTYNYMHRRYAKAVAAKLMDPVDMGRKTNEELKQVPQVRQRVKAMKTHKDNHHTYILTSAQNNTDLHAKTWENLVALADYCEAKLMVGRFMYGKRGLGARNDKAQITRGAVHIPQEETWYDPRIEPYISDSRIEIAKGLVWCGELNILPTAVSPLTGLESYTGRKSMIAPHVTQQLSCVATYGEGDGAKINYCTGTVTQRNYIQRKEGLKAEFHHIYGALFVEVDENGHWWVRQLCADSEGRIYHIDGDDVVLVDNGEITGGHRVESVTSGDTHEAEKDEVVHALKYRKGGMMDVLKPKFNFIHDLFDGGRRSHHNIKDPYFLIEQFVKKQESVEEELIGARKFLEEIKRPDCLTVVVDSNHDRHLDRWLSEQDGRRDPVNARVWSALNSLKVNLIYDGKGGELFRHAIGSFGPERIEYWEKKNHVRFLMEDEGFITCRQYGGGIENGMHGDRAGNGARGNIRSFAKMGRRSSVGHGHTCAIFQGAMMAGTNSKLKLRYNHGASSWTQSDIITFPNSKRCIVTFAFGKWHS